MPKVPPAQRSARTAIFLVALATLACAGTAGALTPEEIVNYRGADREQVLIEGAKKEGQVVLYSGLIVNQMLRPLSAGFMKKYPFLKMTYHRQDSEELLLKLSAESRSNNMIADVFEGSGGGEIAVEAGLTQPFYTPALDPYPKMYLDPKRHLAPTRLSYFSIAYNTKLVPPGKVPKSYADLLDPQWKGRMAWPYANTGRYLFMINLRQAWGEDKAMDYFKKLAEQKVINFASGSARTLVDRVIAGEYPIAINIYAHHPLISAGKGAPVNSQLMDPVPSAAGTLAVLKAAKHPHAAMLLTDFILSKEGQQIMSAAEYFPAHPEVEAAPQLASIVPHQAGYPENYINPQQLKEQLESTDQILQKLFR
ncbi:MAG: iron(III) transport system substrate-binding protein [Alphaproteobacteria bacterium]|jgi:iron(III) transport system substrate-binding protein|nr:iron(III) transport system substrate-binding protein [Alphaproteobacteria bacterium]